MTIKSILCIFSGAGGELNAVNAAFQLGKLHGAHIRFLHLSPDPSAYVGLYGEGIIVTEEMIPSIEKENKERLEKAKQHVATTAAQYRVPLDAPEAPLHHASATFMHLIGMQDNMIAREGRISDLIVIGKYDAASYDALTPALFDTGRPVLVMPSGADGQWQDKIVALAWDGSLQAARALYNALPLVRSAEKFYVLTAQEHGKILNLEAESGVMTYLRTHGIKSQAIGVAIGQCPLPDSILLRAKDLKADLLVMGAYGHSQFREMILGGVTEFMLKHVEIPLLLSH